MPGTAEQPPPEEGRPPVMTQDIESGRIDVNDANRAMVEAFAKEHGLTPPK